MTARHRKNSRARGKAAAVSVRRLAEPSAEPRYPAILRFGAEGRPDYLVIAAAGPTCDHRLPGYELRDAVGIRAAAGLPVDRVLVARAGDSMADDYLTMRRRAAAQEAFEAHNFGNRDVTDMDGWTQDGRYWSRMVYGDEPEGEAGRNGDGRFSCSFGVEFGEDSATVVDTWTQD